MNGSKIPFPNPELWKAIFHQTNDGVIDRQNKCKSWYKLYQKQDNLLECSLFSLYVEVCDCYLCEQLCNCFIGFYENY